MILQRGVATTEPMPLRIRLLRFVAYPWALISLLYLGSLMGPEKVKCDPPVPAQPVTEAVDETTEQKLRPLMDLIANEEGGYDSINRGYAGDTPGGMKSLTGSSLASYTVAEVMGFQNGTVYAVGRYQFIPSTLKAAVSYSDVSFQDKFTSEVQDRLMASLVLHKRPEVGSWLRGEHDDLWAATTGLAKEWASIEYLNGRGYYDGLGGNRASISRAELLSVLNEIKESWQTEG